MTIEEKMNNVLWAALCSMYTVKMVNDFEFEIYYHHTRTMNITTVKSIQNHWKELISDAIHKLVADKIKMSFE